MKLSSAPESRSTATRTDRSLQHRETVTIRCSRVLVKVWLTSSPPVNGEPDLSLDVWDRQQCSVPTCHNTGTDWQFVSAHAPEESVWHDQAAWVSGPESGGGERDGLSLTVWARVPMSLGRGLCSLLRSLRWLSRLMEVPISRSREPVSSR